MMIQIRCKSCGKPLGHLHADFVERIKKEEPTKVFDDLGITRYCCRAQFIGHIELLDTAAQFRKF